VPAFVNRFVFQHPLEFSANSIYHFMYNRRWDNMGKIRSWDEPVGRMAKLMAELYNIHGQGDD
jgi:hypothetical protein